MLKLQYFGHLMQRTDSLEKTLMLGKIEGGRRRGWQRTRWLDSITNSMDMNLSKPRETVKDRGAWRAAVHGVTKTNDLAPEQQLETKYSGLKDWKWEVSRRCRSKQFILAEALLRAGALCPIFVWGSPHWPHPRTRHRTSERWSDSLGVTS